ncbi:MAG TPA: T9SS type A sorting domain-containing protein [Ignavibacteriaceae bacterium]|nr:T9SS type A sorting domain-containing protein [Ignavibacteriaceae bacterium]
MDEFVKIGFVEGSGNCNVLYRLKQIDHDGIFSYSEAIKVETALPTEFILEQNYPNPFNPSTTIRYGLPFESDVKIEIYDIIGQRVVSLKDSGEHAGYH